MGRLTALSLVLLLAIPVASGCSRGPKAGGGAWVVVKPGDTLWRLAERHGSSVQAIERANDDLDPRALRVGRKLWIPHVDVAARGGKASARTLTDHDDAECGGLARREGLEFDWPVLGDLTSAYGAERDGRGHDGIDLAAEQGTPIHAAEAGRVVYADDDLGDYGRVVIVEHVGRWATVYAHNRKNRVEAGDFVERGDVIAEVGDTGNASAPHLHFEVRRSNRPRNPQSCLP
jgi:murein DD-endopeptidase MepM/ murein hydrolase activator NlpD